MNRNELKYYLLIGGSLLAYTLFQILSPRALDWNMTIEHNDKNPFGGYVLNEMMADLFPEESFQRSNNTIYELQDSSFQNLLIIANNFSPWEDELDELMERIANGGTALISAHFFGEALQDTLGFRSSDTYWNGNFTREFTEGDSVSMRFIHPELRGEQSYSYQTNNSFRSFILSDSMNIKVIAVNDQDQPVTIRIPFGKGVFYLNTIPLAFTNYYLLHHNDYKFASTTLSLLPNASIHWTEYYQVGRRESTSPLRYLLQQPPLRWAYYITIISLLIFMVFEAKRRQRIIPVVRPLRNTTLDFVKTISNLYLQQKDHKSIAEKRINFFLDQLRRKFFLPEHLQGDMLHRKIAAKTGQPEEEVKQLFDQIFLIKSQGQITESDLKKLNVLIEKFN